MVIASPAAPAAGLDRLAGARFLPRDELDRLLAALRADGRTVLGPIVADGTITLGEIESAADLPVGIGAEAAPGRFRLVSRPDRRAFDFAVGPMSWKRWTFPPRVLQLTWPDIEAGDRDGEAAGRVPVPPPIPPGRLAFVGVRACEIDALLVQDRVLGDGPVADPDYVARRRAAFVVAVECATALDTCFCTSMGTGPEVSAGFDLAMTELDDGFVVRAGSGDGERVLAGLDLPEAGAGRRVAAAAAVQATRERIGDPVPQEGLAARLVAAADSPHWAEIAERCLACANCTLVCPTCFCTSVGAVSSLDGGDAGAERTWDSCFTSDFARVAGGNFRPRTRDRYRQWLTHKFGTWWDQFGSAGCVGCGRCIAWCPVGIDIRAELVAVAGSPPAEAPAAVDVSAAIHAPAPVTFPAFPVPAELPAGYVEARVASVVRETRDVVTLRLVADDPALAAGRPGQFVMVARPATAAPPISISRFHADGLELTIRAAGPATDALTRLERGATLALRGPLGRGWPVDAAIGRDVVVVTGGIGLAPLRPLLDVLLAERERFGRIRLAYGARTPADRLYLDELEALERRGDVEVAMTVDRAGPEWLGRVGVVTQLIDQDACSGRAAVAFVCGPERMMEATADVFAECGIPPEQIFVTLERHMECGVGLCGHCQLGRYFVCRDGPVFSLAELGSDFRREGI